MIRRSGSIDSHSPLGCPRIFRKKEAIQKAKNCLERKKKASARILSKELAISDRSVLWILKEDLRLRSDRKIIEPSISDD